MKYRPEIDGLRALAVIPVILFHAGFQNFSGGFVGVDVFFVISGYLITTIIISELDQGSFSIVNFYERRARRILPALFFVMAFCVLGAWFWLAPSDLKDFGQSLMAVSIFSSNIFFWQESGYFNTASELKPLLHTWSLAVEEQYYIIFPVILMLFWRTGIRVLMIFLAVGFLLSFAVADWGAYNKPDAAFYLLPTRGWELLVGVFVAFYLRYKKYLKSDLLNQLLSLIGFGLIVFAIVAFDHSTPFPGRYALFPTIGTGLLILSAVPTTLVYKILAIRPIVAIGLISYSAYLWHQPILAFARQRYPWELSGPVLLGLCLLSLVLAYVSWRWIEYPFRNKEKFDRASIFKLSLIGLILFAAVGFWLDRTDGALKRYSAKEQAVLSQFFDPAVYVEQRFESVQLNEFDESSKKKVILIGDSFAEDLTNAIYESGAISNLSLSGYFIDVECGSLMIEKTVLAPHQGIDCTNEANFYNNETLLERLRTADEVWLASYWYAWNFPFLSESLKNIKALNQNIKVFGPKYFGEVRAKDFKQHGLEKWKQEVSLSEKEVRIRTDFESRRATLMQKLARENVEFVDLQTALCAGTIDCPNFDGENIISFDGGHLTRYGAKLLGDELLRQGKI